MCPEIDQLLKVLPVAEGPERRVEVVGVSGPEGVVDGLCCTVFRNGETGRFWFHLGGGVGRVDQWYGPVEGEDERVKGLVGRLGEVQKVGMLGYRDPSTRNPGHRDTRVGRWVGWVLVGVVLGITALLWLALLERSRG